MKKQLAPSTQKRYDSDSKEDTECSVCHKRLLVRAWKYCQACEPEVKSMYNRKYRKEK